MIKRFGIRASRRSDGKDDDGSINRQSLTYGEYQCDPPRTSRFVATQRGWFVKTRENFDLGPFESRSMAQEALSQFIKKRAQARVREQAEDYKLGYSVHDVEACTRENCAVCIEAAEKAAAIRNRRTQP